MNDQFPIIFMFCFLIIGIMTSTITKSLNVHEVRSLNSMIDDEFERFLVLESENIRFKNLLVREKEAAN
ncbi:MAG: hypothetical protein CMQ87_03395 [Gammaproteobacteria bacterium]|jgi:uncharacterized membrane protein YedE/YeeE|nr:hypothetical protein [Gammaproteobacteria bacterium]|tara:strand:- start:2612 stop:2818 length:207 start_codon:yes stop_codon:yes gene_type:complete